jgi:hypothetical protein
MGMINAGFSQGFSMFGFPRNRNGSSDFFNRPSLMALSNMASNPPVDADGFVDMNYLTALYQTERGLLLDQKNRNTGHFLAGALVPRFNNNRIQNMGMLNGGFSQGFAMFDVPGSQNWSSDFFNTPSLMALSNMASNPPVDADGFVDMNYLTALYQIERGLL